MTRFRLLDTGLRSAAENMALDEILTRRAGQGTSPPTLRFLRFKPDAALLGYHQQAERELRLDYCRAQGIEINRRLTGGGALLFQTSALGWELIAPLGQPPFTGGFERALERICRSAARAYSQLGVQARFRPRNDIEVEGRKISGTGGLALEGGALFQGTVLVKNEIERFLRALRVPVEKLKKREIESLMERLAFLEDLVGPVDLEELKAILARQFAHDLELELEPAGITPQEEAELAQRLPYYQSEEWINLRRAPEGRPAWLRDILQTDQGTLRFHLWLDTAGRRVQKALVTGDFFSQPQRLIFDLEAWLMGKKAEPRVLEQAVLEFFRRNQGELLGIGPETVARAAARAAARRVLARHFTEQEAAELFFVSLDPAELGQPDLARWMLLPYCSKPVDCSLRKVPDCARCGECQFDPLYQLAEELGMIPVSIQSFEHLMVVLRDLSRRGEGFMGSCCEAFYCKHQREMEECGARGVLINLDSTTCYDLGKGMEAYVGNFDHQTFMNTELITKVARLLAGDGGERASA